ncbi:MAG TPA: site-2 protease family protein [Candidatus Dormibacteraeota bacterium]|nr:site-2 protease family protein [Candidatus Dormibacteraeota bacterium]
MSSSTFPVEPLRNCHNCGAPLSLGAIVCPQCHTLLHSEQLVRLSAAAKAQEERGEVLAARDTWASALPLLPHDSDQAQWIRGHIYKLEISARNNPDAAATAAAPKYQWAKRLGPLAPIAILLAKSQAFLLALFKFKFIFSLLAYMAIYWQLFGAKFGIGFVLLILIHEMGHFVDIRRRGLPAEMPVFLPGLGAYVRWQALGVTRQTRAEVSLAGPFAGLLAAMVCAAMWFYTGEHFWAALTRTGAWLNIVNLTPIWVLDGGQAANALSKPERFMLLAACGVLGAFVRDWSIAIVAAGVAYRLFTDDLPPQGSSRIAVYYIGVLSALALMMYLVPGHLFDAR